MENRTETRAEKLLNDVLQTLDYYGDIDSSFPGSYNLDAVQVMLMAQIATSLKQIARNMKDNKGE